MTRATKQRHYESAGVVFFVTGIIAMCFALYWQALGDYARATYWLVW